MFKSEAESLRTFHTEAMDFKDDLFGEDALAVLREKSLELQELQEIAVGTGNFELAGEVRERNRLALEVLIPLEDNALALKAVRSAFAALEPVLGLEGAARAGGLAPDELAAVLRSTPEQAPPEDLPYRLTRCEAVIKTVHARAPGMDPATLREWMLTAVPVEPDADPLFSLGGKAPVDYVRTEVNQSSIVMAAADFGVAQVVANPQIAGRQLTSLKGVIGASARLAPVRRDPTSPVTFRYGKD